MTSGRTSFGFVRSKNTREHWSTMMQAINLIRLAFSDITCARTEEYFTQMPHKHDIGVCVLQTIFQAFVYTRRVRLVTSPPSWKCRDNRVFPMSTTSNRMLGEFGAFARTIIQYPKPQLINHHSPCRVALDIPWQSRFSIYQLVCNTRSSVMQSHKVRLIQSSSDVKRRLLIALAVW